MPKLKLKLNKVRIARNKWRAALLGFTTTLVLSVAGMVITRLDVEWAGLAIVLGFSGIALHSFVGLLALIISKTEGGSS